MRSRCLRSGLQIVHCHRLIVLNFTTQINFTMMTIICMSSVSSAKTKHARKYPRKQKENSNHCCATNCKPAPHIVRSIRVASLELEQAQGADECANVETSQKNSSRVITPFKALSCQIVDTKHCHQWAHSAASQTLCAYVRWIRVSRDQPYHC